MLSCLKCLKCREKKHNKILKFAKISKGRLMILLTCVVCDSKKTRFIKE